MNLTSLEEALIAEKLRGWYLNGGLIDDTFTIGRTAGGWEIYHSERGQKYGLKTFAEEDEACQYFLATTRRASLAEGNA